MSESVDPALLNRGFDDSNEDEVGVRRLDDDTQESEDWAERDLRELRTTVSSGAAERRAERRCLLLFAFPFLFFPFFFFFSSELSTASTLLRGVSLVLPFFPLAVAK